MRNCKLPWYLVIPFIFIVCKADVSYAQLSLSPRQTGVEILNELTTKPGKVIVRVGSNGCTGKGSFRVDVKKEEGLSSNSPHYVLTIVRTTIDECKALMGSGSLITFDLIKDVGLTGNYTYSVMNRMFQNENLVINEAKAKNFNYYLSVPKQYAQLKNGKFEKGNEPANYLNVKLIGHVIEDLDGNGTDDAVVVLASTGMGSGSFFEITALIADTEDDSVHQTNSIVLGDRIELNKLSVTSEKIELKLTVPGPDDPSCCPTKKAIKQFRLMGGKLVELKYGN